MPEPAVMDWRGRAATLAALAMLPVGMIAALVSALAVVATLLMLFVAALFQDRTGRAAFAVWSAAAAVIAIHNTVASLEALSALSWRRFVSVLLWSAVALATFPGWWID